MTAHRIKCRFCEATFAAFRTNKRGQTKTAWGALEAHMINRHFDEYQKIKDELGPEEDASACKVCGVPITTGELCSKCAESNDPFFTAENSGKDLR